MIRMDTIHHDLKQLILKEIKLCTKIMHDTLRSLKTHFKLICNVKLNGKKNPKEWIETLLYMQEEIKACIKILLIDTSKGKKTKL